MFISTEYLAMTKPKLIAVAAAMLICAFVPAKAASEAQIRRDCTADALQYCATSIPKGRAAIIRCMVANRSNLSAQCKQHLR